MRMTKAERAEADREQREIAERFYSGVARAQKSKDATPIEMNGAHLAKPCCDTWEVDMHLYWPKRIWIFDCLGCGATFTESAVTKNKTARSS